MKNKEKLKNARIYIELFCCILAMGVGYLEAMELNLIVSFILYLGFILCSISIIVLNCILNEKKKTVIWLLVITVAVINIIKIAGKI